MSLTNVLENIGSKKAQSIVEYIVLFTVLSVFCMGLIAGLLVDGPGKSSTHPGAAQGLNLRNVFGQAINKAIERINR
jgi:hypothetical protein